MPLGHAIWVYESSDDIVAEINAFNRQSPVGIRYVFVYAGTISDAITFTDDALTFYSQSLPDLDIYPTIDGVDHEFGELTTSERQDIVNDIAKRYDGDDRVAGIHVDLEPFSEACVVWYNAITTAMSKPLSAALYRWNDKALSLIDLPVLMAYDIGASPDAYGRGAGDLIDRFAAGCRQAKRPFVVGLPFVATHVEYEYRIAVADDARESTGHTMNAYLRRGLDCLESGNACSQCTGIGIWGGLTGPIGGKSEPWRWHPYRISSENWTLLESFSRGMIGRKK